MRRPGNPVYYKSRVRLEEMKNGFYSKNMANFEAFH